MDARLTDVQRQLDTVSGLPVIVNGLLATIKQHEEEIEELKMINTKRREWRIGQGAANIIAGFGVIVAFVALLIATHA